MPTSKKRTKKAGVLTVSDAELAKIPFATVAAIAATLLRPKENGIGAVKDAYGLLAYAIAAQRGLTDGRGVEQAMQDQQLAKVKIFIRSLKNHILPIHDEDNPDVDSLPHDFDSVLQKLMHEVDASDVRESRFIDWLASYASVAPKAVNEAVREWKKDKIPYSTCREIERMYKSNYNDWWKSEKSRIARQNKMSKKRSQLENSELVPSLSQKQAPSVKKSSRSS